jgi:hypothetical protein
MNNEDDDLLSIDVIVYDKAMTILSHFGITYIIMFKDNKGKPYIWRSTTLKGAERYASLSIGDSVTLTLSTGEHEYFKDMGSNIMNIDGIKC